MGKRFPPSCSGPWPRGGLDVRTRSPALDRRGVMLALLGIGASVGACSENPNTGRSQLIVVSDEMLTELSAQTWAEIKRTVPQSSDQRAQTRLRAIGEQMIARANLPGLDWEFVVFDSPEINAFVLPGGKIGFYRGLIDIVANDGEIAAVMGHELGHVLGRHAAERVSQQEAVRLGVAAASLAFSEDLGEYADEAAAALGAGLTYGVILPYSRAHELEADRIGVDLMSKASFDPGDAVRFWERMVATNEASGAPLAWLSTHPAGQDRLEALRALI